MSWIAKNHKGYYELWDKGHFVKHIGNAEKYEKYLADLEKKERSLAQLNGVVPKANTPDMPDGKFDVIYTDPPWRYDFDVESRATENHYPTLKVSEIRNIKDKKGIGIRDKRDDNCILYMWATAPKLNEAFEVIRAWGFTYKTNMVWVKDKIGLGWYCRNQHELLLIAERGEMPLPAADIRPSSVLSFPRTTHSTKPQEIYNLIEKWYPNRKYLEVFGVNNNRPNWSVFGNNVYK